MPYLPDSNNPTRDRRAEYGLAEEARAEKRKQDATLIDPAASKWRYRPAPRAAKLQREA
jgi:hypothetical protein